MKPLSTIIFFCYLSAINMNSFAQYVTIQEKQFYTGNGQPFYPMIVNWGPAIIYDPVSSTYHLSTYHSFGTGNSFECSGNLPLCDDQILNELNYIADMGFNGIRINGLYPRYNGTTGNLYFIATDPITDPINWTNHNVEMQPPYTDTNSQIFFSMYDKILDLASQVNTQPFYVILNSWGTSNRQQIPPGIGNWTTYDWETVIQPLYTQFLVELGNQFQNNQNLMAYDFFNEPCLALAGEHTKEEVCTITNEWYDSVTTHDHHHLTTAGNCWDDVMEFDPAVMKLDFVSPHFYPATRVFQYENPAGTYFYAPSSVADYNARVEGILY